MLKTEKYKFNIIETADTFSPDALNANARTAETELIRVEAKAAADKAELQAADAALRASMGSGGKTCRIVWGSYVGNGEYGREHPSSLTFDFKPHMIFALYASTYIIMQRGCISSIGNSVYTCVSAWEDRSVSWYNTQSSANQLNINNVTYYYVAIGESF